MQSETVRSDNDNASVLILISPAPSIAPILSLDGWRGFPRRERVKVQPDEPMGILQYSHVTLYHGSLLLTVLGS